ncbi:acyl-CoA-binding domain-containing protein 4 isoform X2 [Mixophyes fleayi]|uniref:acyl-CoA-binding domain-containing protein 4 isoform X2 n=1 Tax=Mixophyes fleayi TaxID=3061075 RepID=UPI003F4DBD9A
MGTDQDENETEYRRQFNAAVSVIQSLPKSGSYRPSYDEMLRFYGYYKQSTVGPCNISRPGFWDPVGRYKWDAWNKMGGMSQEDAMCAYIKEMKMVAQKIINTVPLEDTSPEMFEPFRPLYEMIPDMPRPPDFFFKISTEKETSEDIKEQEANEGIQDQISRDDHHYAQSADNSHIGAHSGQEESEQRRRPVGETTHPAQVERRLQSLGSEKHFPDSLDQLEPEEVSAVTHKNPKAKIRRQSAKRLKDNVIVTVPHSTSDVWLRNGENGSDMSTGLQTKCRSSSAPHLSPQITATVEALQASIQGLCQRLESLERVLQDAHQHIDGQTHRSHKMPKSQHPVNSQSQTLLFILVWPFIVHWLLQRFFRRKR